MGRSSRVSSALTHLDSPDFLPVVSPKTNPVAATTGYLFESSDSYESIETFAGNLLSSKGYESKEWQSALKCLRHLATVAADQKKALDALNYNSHNLSPSRLGDEVRLSDGRSGTISLLPERWREGYVNVGINSNGKNSYLTDVLHWSRVNTKPQTWTQNPYWYWPGEKPSDKPILDRKSYMRTDTFVTEKVTDSLSAESTSDTNNITIEDYNGLSLRAVLEYIKLNGWFKLDTGTSVAVYRRRNNPESNLVFFSPFTSEGQIDPIFRTIEKTLGIDGIDLLDAIERLESIFAYEEPTIQGDWKPVGGVEVTYKGVMLEEVMDLKVSQVVKYLESLGMKKIETVSIENDVYKKDSWNVKCPKPGLSGEKAMHTVIDIADRLMWGDASKSQLDYIKDMKAMA